MVERTRALVWLHGEIRTPPFSKAARMEAGLLLRQLQDGEPVGFPHSRPLPSIGRQCHELRIQDERVSWRLVYRLDRDAVLILEVFEKRTRKTPQRIIETCRARLQRYDQAAGEQSDG